MIVIGIDLAGVEKRGSGFCIMRGLTAETRLLYSDEEIISEVLLTGSEVVAIDAPLSLPVGRCCLEDTCSCRNKNHFRFCDLELRKMSIKFFPITIGPMRLLTKRGIGLKKTLEDQGIKILETYPGAAQDLWKIPRKRDLKGLRFGLKKLGVKGQINKPGLTDHELDAISCALVGRLYILKKYIAIGDEKEGLMFLPKTLL